MSYRSLLPLTVAAVFALCPGQLQGQAANIACDVSVDPLVCAGTSGASAPQDFVTEQPPSPDLRLAAASVGAILAQRREDKAALWQAWSGATSDNARLAAQRARANYNAMTTAMEQVAGDTVPWSEPALNRDLNLDFSLLKDVEARYEDENPDTGRRREALTRMSFTPSAGGEGTFRLEEDGEIFAGQQKGWTYRSGIRYEPASFLLYQTEATIPRSSAAFPGYEAAALVGDHAFSVSMAPKARIETKVAPGAVYPTMLGLIISAMAGELPASFTIWIVDDQGEAVPAQVSVVGELTVQEPVGPDGGTCVGATGINQPRRAVQLQVSAGAYSHTRVVLADAPHLKVSDGLKCRVVR